MPDKNKPYATKLGYAFGAIVATCLAILATAFVTSITAKLVIWLFAWLF